MAVDGTATSHDLWLALLASGAAGGPRRAAKVLLQSGRRRLEQLVGQVQADEQQAAEEVALELAEQSVGVIFCDDPKYPERLRSVPGAPPVLFYRGPIELLERTSIGVCGSRNVGSNGLRAARACGQEAASLGITVVSGYAKGVDTEAHLSTLSAGGNTVAVLAEGIMGFRVKQAYGGLSDGALGRLLVVSQFPPRQRWTAGAAMARNQVIVGLGEAIVAIEAGETGGTLRAGEAALQAGRPLWVLSFPAEEPPGNKLLLAAGGRCVASRAELRDGMHNLLAEPRDRGLFD